MQVQVRGEGVRKWVVFGAIAFGALFMIVGLILAGVSVSYLAGAERAPGRVVALEWRNDHTSSSRKKRVNDEPAAYPVIEFTSNDGTPRKFRDAAGTNPPSYEVGEQVEVLYRADSPEDARINGFASLWLLPLIFGGIGLLFSGIGTVIALVMRRHS
ncbi:predicted protein [Streptomyces viridochromogenes DSM 40736]|uniref:Predicted protein n=1 Tax=Streptomyces viridochromogenes (strain DSM 40736 / JCM 4977 / BCRC 1201 / Tue 494) TaxID=591159 RepID=D9XG78_STRVT|nr:DUF3592 domain-containing protein [Streptomyces viridochromogenes]EFL36967.1 predicted protein [Streptomyces viridochromogenes DSM 40736]